MTVNELVSILKTLTGKEVLVYFLKFADKIINISNENENICVMIVMQRTDFVVLTASPRIKH